MWLRTANFFEGSLPKEMLLISTAGYLQFSYHTFPLAEKTQSLCLSPNNTVRWQLCCGVAVNAQDALGSWAVCFHELE